MSMVPCKFYASGNCRYGNNCRFYHEPRNNQQTAFFGNRTLAPATFQPQGVAPNQSVLNLSSKTNSNLDIIIEQVKKDMQEWQACKIWPYSCYGPVGNKGSVPGFEDLSPEEFRLAYMQSGNNVPPEVIQRFQQINQLRVNYQQSTLENRTLIERIVKADSALSAAQTVFGGTQTSQTQAAGIFGGSANQQSTGLFGNSSTFGQPQQPPSSSIFGGSFGGNTAVQPSSGGLFQTPAAAPAAGLFVAQNQSQPAFGVVAPQQSSVFQQPQQQQTGLFQQQPAVPQQTTTPFLQQQPALVGNQPIVGNIFQQQPAIVAPGVQGSFFQQPQTQVPQQQPAPGLFQQPQQPQQTQPGSFNPNQQAGSTFQAPTSNIFGGATQQAPTTAPGANIFGGSPAAFPQSQGGIQQQPNPTSLATQKFVYSDESELTPEELEAFKSQEFSIDSLPLKPPPQSLCI
ncbi:unnamed protein product [Orchesella dallaii]|uniref:Nucleoporin NUP42 n=1 Tax=Orchesella dallaii TaxID=48710 RepID=A0ABP1S5R7_9HEXA